MRRLRLIVILISIHSVFWGRLEGSPLKTLFRSENEEMIEVIKDALDTFKLDMTKKFMLRHSRAKRELAGHVNDLDVNTESVVPEFAIDSAGPFSTFAFAGKPYVIQRTGIYEISDTYLSALSSGTMVTMEEALVEKGTWTLRENEQVLHGFEWKRSYFLVTTTGKLSSIYTLHETNLKPVFRQNIQNRGNAVAAELFQHRKNLYMIVLNDHESHATTFSPMFLWAGSYMDEIHQIQTTGATAVKTFPINSKQYIAISQGEDSTGNTELGTIVLSMNPQSKLEKVQLLWSDSAHSLHHMRTDKENFLVVGQDKEPSIVYWFGGMDFIYWQQLDNLQGKDLIMDGLQLTSDEPILLAVGGAGQLKMFSRSASPTKIMTTWVKSREKNVLGLETQAGKNSVVGDMNILNLGNENVFMTLVKNIPGSEMESLKVYPVTFSKREISVSQTPQGGDEVSTCLGNLRQNLKDSQDALQRIDALSSQVLTTDSNIDFSGKIVSKSLVKPADSMVTLARVLSQPDGVDGRAGNGPRLQSTPSDLKISIESQNDQLELMKLKMDNLVYKSTRPNVITGDLMFTKTLDVDTWDAQGTDLNFESLNGVKWEDFENFVLRTRPMEGMDSQEVIAKWAVGTLTAKSIETKNPDSQFAGKGFMMTRCERSQVVNGPSNFQEITASEVKLDEVTAINGIAFSNIVLKNNPVKEITGFKHAPSVTGTYTTGTINNKTVEAWFSQVARISGATTQEFEGPVVFMDTVAVDDIVVEQVNGRKWNEYKSNVMLNGVDQTVEGDFDATSIQVDDLTETTISEVSVEDLIVSGQRDQRITSEFNVDSLIVGSLSCNNINGVNINDAVQRNEKFVEINSPAILDSFKVEEVNCSDAVTIADKDVSELVKMQKTHFYSTANGEPIVLQGLVTDQLDTSHINGEHVDHFGTMYWSKSSNNEINPAQLILDNRKVMVTEGSFNTDKLNHFSFPEEYISLDQVPITLVSPLKFMKPVTFKKDVKVADGATIEGVDLSEAKNNIVDADFKGPISGEKTFVKSVTVSDKATLDDLNGRDPAQDAVLLNSEQVQRIDGSLSFVQPVHISDNLVVKDGTVEVEGFVNELNLERVKEQTAYLNEANVVQGPVELTNAVIVDDFSTKELNGMDAMAITDNLIFLNSPELQTIIADVILEDGNADFLLDSLCGRLNQVPVGEYLTEVVRLDTNEPLTISGTKNFKNANLKGQLLCSSVNGVNLKDLKEKGLSKSTEQQITGSWTLNQANLNEGLMTSHIGGADVDNIVFTNEPSVVNSEVIFSSKDTKVKGPINVEGSVNGIKIDGGMLNGIQINGAKNFDQVQVDGNMEWAEDQKDLKGLSHFFDNAVRKSEPQVITGNVIFNEGLQTGGIQSTQWLGNVNLQQINDDAIKRNSPDEVITGSNNFVQVVQLQNPSQPVTVSLLNTDTVNNLNLAEEAQNVVLATNPTGSKRKPIGGIKSVKSRIQAENVNVDESIGGVPVSNLVVVNDVKEIGQVQFTQVTVESAINPEATEGVDLKRLLNDRISKTAPVQNLRGSYELNQVDVEGCAVSSINDVNMANILRKGELNQQTKIGGQKTFKNLAVPGRLITGNINNHEINDLLDNTVRLDRPASINRPVIFQAPITVNQNFDVETVNGVHLPTFSDAVSERVTRILTEAESPSDISQDFSGQILKLEKLSAERPVYLEYFRMKKDLTSWGFGGQSRVSHVQRSPQGDILVSLHSESNGQEKQLPKGCPCNSVKTFNLTHFVGNEAHVETLGDDKCLNVYHVESQNQNSYTIVSDTASSNTSCVSGNDGTTQIFTGKTQLSDMPMGFISDVSVFSDGATDYLVLAQYFDPNTATHSTVTRVMKVNRDTGSVEGVQDIATHGAKKVAISQVNDVWMMAIANSKSASDEGSCVADSAIYIWSEETTQFLLMRDVMTDGAFDVQFITTKTANEFYRQSFVAFAQQGNSASGEVLLYKYENLDGNFVMAQTIRSNWPIEGLRTTCMCDKCFLVTMVPQEGITFYENRFVEGFREYYKAPVFGATDLTGFNVDGQHLFAIATKKGPILAEAVIAGSC